MLIAECEEDTSYSKLSSNDMLQFRGLAHFEWADNFHFIHFHSHLVCFMALAKCCKNLIYNPQVEPLIIHDEPLYRVANLFGDDHMESLATLIHLLWVCWGTLRDKLIWVSYEYLRAPEYVSQQFQFFGCWHCRLQFNWSLSILFELDFRRVFVNMRKIFSLFPLRQPLEALTRDPQNPQLRAWKACLPLTAVMPHCNAIYICITNTSTWVYFYTFLLGTWENFVATKYEYGWSVSCSIYLRIPT